MEIIKNAGSRFWMDETMFVRKQNASANSADLMRYASVKRAIANFVRIVTSKNIPVRYSTGGTFTDGKVVTIGANGIKTNEFDSTVGLALHEASHILLSDFNLLKKLSNNPQILELNKEFRIKYPKARIDVVYERVKTLLNIIEDRRIDKYIYDNAPGYRVYYRAMYDKYFNAPIVEEALRSANYRDESWDAYLFRLTNIMSKNRVLDALEKLPEICNLIDFANISRFTTTADVLDVALKVYKIIEDQQLSKEEQKQNNQDGGSAKFLGYSAKGLPTGVTINRRTGKITGRIETKGSYTVIITSHYSDKKMRRKITITF